MCMSRTPEFGTNWLLWIHPEQRLRDKLSRTLQSGIVSEHGASVPKSRFRDILDRAQLHLRS